MSGDLFQLLRTTPLKKVAPSVWYPGYLPGMPDLLVLRMPPALHRRGAATGLNREMRIIFVETDTERRQSLRCLEQPIDVKGNVVNFRTGIDRVNLRPSTLRASQNAVWMFQPSEPEWPWFVVTALVKNVPGAGLARQRYGWDAFPDESSAMDHMTKMIGATAQDGIGIEIRTPDPKQQS